MGMPAVLLALCIFFTWATYESEAPSGWNGGVAAADLLLRRNAGPTRVLLVTGSDPQGAEFARGVRQRLPSSCEIITAGGGPPDVRATLSRLNAQSKAPHVVLATPDTGRWALWRTVRQTEPGLGALQVIVPRPEGRSAFLSPTNLRNVADQIAVIAIIAVGMTMVIITGGIDLSVGSLVAFSAVVTAWFIRALGGVHAGPWALVMASLGSILLSGGVGLVSGAFITAFRIPPFIATLAMMQVASGLAFIVAQGQTIYDIPQSFTALGRGNAIASLPNAVVLMLVIYAAAHVFMTRTAMGRRIYAVGGNAEAARLSGVSNSRTLLFVYIVSGFTAGIGGVITASQLKAGAPTYGVMYELFVIAAVVVGGSSLSGGQGQIFGTLVGAFIIAVIRNGMNLMNVEPYTQKIVLGLVILGAVLLDMLRKRKTG